MRSKKLLLLLLFALFCPSIVGCGDGGNKLITTSEIENYVEQNPDAIARQRAAREGGDE